MRRMIEVKRPLISDDGSGLDHMDGYARTYDVLGSFALSFEDFLTMVVIESDDVEPCECVGGW